MKESLKHLIITTLILSFGGCTSGALKPPLNKPLYLRPRYNVKVGVLIFDDDRAEDVLLDSAFTNLPVNEAISSYFAKDLNHSNLFAKVTYINEERPYSNGEYKRIQKEHDVDFVLAGEIEELTLKKGSISPYNYFYAFSPTCLLPNLLGLPIPPLVGTYAPVFRVTTTLYDLKTMEPKEFDIEKTREEFNSPATFWYYIITEGKIEELNNVVKDGSLKHSKQIQLVDLLKKQ